MQWAMIESLTGIAISRKEVENEVHPGKLSSTGIDEMVEKVLFTNPSARAGFDTRSIFKWSLTGLNSEFSF